MQNTHQMLQAPCIPAVTLLTSSSSYHFPLGNVHVMHSRDAVHAVACCSGPSRQRVANGCMMVHAVLTAVLEWANYQPVIAASVDCLRLMLHYLTTGRAMLKPIFMP